MIPRLGRLLAGKAPPSSTSLHRDHLLVEQTARSNQLHHTRIGCQYLILHNCLRLQPSTTSSALPVMQMRHKRFKLASGADSILSYSLTGPRKSSMQREDPAM